MTERRAAALTCMAAGVGMSGAGAALTWGAGMGVLLAGLLLVGAAILLGWE